LERKILNPCTGSVPLPLAVIADVLVIGSRCHKKWMRQRQWIALPESGMTSIGHIACFGQGRGIKNFFTIQ